VQKGISQVMEVVQRSNGDLNAVGEKIRALGDEYGILGNQRFGSGGDSPPVPGADPGTNPYPGY
jgi:hypothetical protein